jgi:hypothetical protein
VAERWVRAPEDKPGAFARPSAGGPSSYTLSRRGAAPNAKTLPESDIPGYDAFLQLYADDARMRLVVLVSDEHDDVPRRGRCRDVAHRDACKLLTTLSLLCTPPCAP